MNYIWKTIIEKITAEKEEEIDDDVVQFFKENHDFRKSVIVIADKIIQTEKPIKEIPDFDSDSDALS